MGAIGWLKDFVGVGGEGRRMPSEPPEDGLRQIEEEKKRKKQQPGQSTQPDWVLKGTANIRRRRALGKSYTDIPNE